MNAIELKDAQTLWKMFYACECFTHSKTAAQHILDAKLEREDPLFVPLITSVYALYARPFTRADPVGKLGEEMIPKESLDLHRLMLEHRHKIYVHKDAVGVPVGDFGPANQVRVSVKASKGVADIKLFATDFHARYPLMPSIIKLCTILHGKCDYHVVKLWKRHSCSIPKKTGEYSLNVHDLAASIWLPQEPMR